MADRSVQLNPWITCCIALSVGLLLCSTAVAQGPPPEPRLWSAVSAMDAIAQARACTADPACSQPETPDGLVVDPGTGQALLSVHVKGATGVTALLDWAAATPGVEAEGKELLVFGETGYIIDLAMDLLDLSTWDGLVAVLDAMSVDAFVSLHAVQLQSPGAHADVVGVDGLLQACAGDIPCLKAIAEDRLWLDPYEAVAAIQIDVPHGGAPGEQDSIVGELTSLAWTEPPVVFEITSMATGEVVARVHGRLPTGQLDGLQAWFDGQTFSAWTRPMTGDELSMVRLTLPVAEAAADLFACGSDSACHHDVSALHGAVVSPAGRLGIIFQGEDPDIEGLNGLEYPGWSMAPPGYMVDGATGLLSFDALRDVALDRWELGEALSIKPDDNPDLLGLSLTDWLAAWTADDVPLLYAGTADLDGDGYDSTAQGGDDCDDGNPDIHPGAVEAFNCVDDDCDGSLLPGEDADSDGDGWLACTDCDDGNPDVSPGGDDGWVPGNCDGLDSDCDGLLGPDETDDDGDGFSECDGDVDDTDPAIQGPPPEPQIWSAISAMDVLAAARTCQAEPTCTSFDAPVGLVTEPTTGQPLLSVHSKGAMDIGPLLDWAAATPGVEIDSKLVRVFDMTGHEVDVSMDLLDPSAWAGLRGALELIGSDAFASIHGIHEQTEGVHSSLATAESSIAGCAGDVPCLDQLHEAEPWLSPFEGLGAVQLEVAHDGQAGKHDSIVAELEALSWGEPAVYFAVEDSASGYLVRAVGRLTVAQLAGLQGWLDGQPFDAKTRPLTEDEFSMVRLQLTVAEAAADLVSCFGDSSCHHAVGQSYGAVVSPAGRLGIIFAGEDPDIEGLNGLEYPGWSMAPPGYMVDGATGLVSWESLRDLGLGRWELGEALSLKPDDNVELVALDEQAWQAAWGPDDLPEQYHLTLPDADGDCYLLQYYFDCMADEVSYLNCFGAYGLPAPPSCPDGWLLDGADCDPMDPDVYPGAPVLCDGKDNDCDPSSLETFPDAPWPGGEQDNDSDGYFACADDCDDYDAGRHPGAVEVCDGLDTDCDGWRPSEETTDHDSDGYPSCADCDDMDQDTNPGAVEVCDGSDNDCDGNHMAGELTDGDSDGWRACADCDDTDPVVHPGAQEACDGADQDCDGVVPSEEFDGDGDGFLACEECDDFDSGVFPGAQEFCDGLDSDCDGAADFEALTHFDERVRSDTIPLEASFLGLELVPYYDVVLERVAQRVSGLSSAGPDPELCVYVKTVGNPYALVWSEPMTPGTMGNWWESGELEVMVPMGAQLVVGVCLAETSWGFGLGTFPTSEVVPSVGWPSPLGWAASTVWDVGEWPRESFADYEVETDSYLVPEQLLSYRVATEWDSDGNGLPDCQDCDEAADEECDGFDNDCDGLVPQEELDLDGDGWTSCAGDCDDTDPWRHPFAEEACDGVDRDCVDEDLEWDLDADGAMPCDGDCDDNDPDRHPGATELCDSIDQDCDGDSEDWKVDSDGDGVWDCFDCEPDDPAVAPGIAEICNDGVDQDCDGVDLTTADNDSDGFSGCNGDCDDYDSSRAPDQPDLRDGVDNDCDGAVDGFVPSVRLHWSDPVAPAIADLEPFWGPTGFRRPVLDGEFLAFTRRPDGTIADLEALDLDPLLGGHPDPTVSTWSDLGLGLAESGTLWLEAGDAVQLVIARREPWEELGVVLLPEPGPLPMPPEGVPLNAAGGWGDCDYIGDAPTYAHALVDMAHVDYFPWIELDAPESAYSLWSASSLITCAPSGCKHPPELAELEQVCLALRHSSRAAAASVSQIDWLSPMSIEWEAGRTVGSRIVLHPTFIADDAWIETAAHEIGHAYTFALYPQATGLAGDWEVQYFIDQTRALFRDSHRGVDSLFWELVSQADGTEVASSCMFSMDYISAMFDFGFLYQGSREDAMACGFRPGWHTPPFYPGTSAMEDIAGWVAESVVVSAAGYPDAFCMGLPLSLADLQPTDLVQFGKLIMLQLGGFLAPSVADGCVASLMPSWTSRANEMWSESSDPDYLFSGPVGHVQAEGELQLIAGSGAQLLRIRDGTILAPGNPLAFAAVVPMNIPSADFSPVFAPSAPVMESYFQRTPPDLESGGDGCHYTAPYTGEPGVYGLSVDGALVLVATANGGRFGAALGTPIRCGWDPGLPDASVGVTEEREADGAPVIFSVMQ